MVNAFRFVALTGAIIVSVLATGSTVYADDGLSVSDRLKIKKAKILSQLGERNPDEPLTEEERSIIDIDCKDGQKAFVRTEEHKTRVRGTTKKINIKVGDIIVVCM